MAEKGDTAANRNRLADLLKQFNAIEAAGGGKANHPEHDKRNELLDELQDAAGLAGRMVMERDILKRAEQLLKNR